MNRPGPMLSCALISSKVLLLPETQIPHDSWFLLLFCRTPVTSRPFRLIQLPVTSNPLIRQSSRMAEKSNTGFSPGYAQYLIGLPELPLLLNVIASTRAVWLPQLLLARL